MRYVTAWASDAASRSGQRSASSPPSSGRVRGRCSSSPRPAREQLRHVHAGDVERRAGEASLEHGLHDRTEREPVPSADEVQRRAHQRPADGTPCLDQLAQLLRSEAAQPGPQSDVWGVWRLRLHAGQMLDRVERRHRHSLEQRLPRESRPVERPGPEQLAWSVHRVVVTGIRRSSSPR